MKTDMCSTYNLNYKDTGSFSVAENGPTLSVRVLVAYLLASLESASVSLRSNVRASRLGQPALPPSDNYIRRVKGRDWQSRAARSTLTVFLFH